MATKVYEEKTVTLFSGKEVKLRPLKISVLRHFMLRFEELGDVSDDNNGSFDVLIDCIAIAMRQYDTDLSDKTEGGKEKLEDELDMPTAYKIIEVAAGIKLGDDEDPKEQ